MLAAEVAEALLHVGGDLEVTLEQRLLVVQVPLLDLQQVLERDRALVVVERPAPLAPLVGEERLGTRPGRRWPGSAAPASCFHSCSRKAASWGLTLLSSGLGRMSPPSTFSVGSVNSACLRTMSSCVLILAWSASRLSTSSERIELRSGSISLPRRSSSARASSSSCRSPICAGVITLFRCGCEPSSSSLASAPLAVPPARRARGRLPGQDGPRQHGVPVAPLQGMDRCTAGVRRQLRQPAQRATARTERGQRAGDRRRLGGRDGDVRLDVSLPLPLRCHLAARSLVRHVGARPTRHRTTAPPRAAKPRGSLEPPLRLPRGRPSAAATAAGRRTRGWAAPWRSPTPRRSGARRVEQVRRGPARAGSPRSAAAAAPASSSSAARRRRRPRQMQRSSSTRREISTGPRRSSSRSCMSAAAAARAPRRRRRARDGRRHVDGSTRSGSWNELDLQAVVQSRCDGRRAPSGEAGNRSRQADVVAQLLGARQGAHRATSCGRRPLPLPLPWPARARRARPSSPGAAASRRPAAGGSGAGTSPAAPRSGPGGRPATACRAGPARRSRSPRCSRGGRS